MEGQKPKCPVLFVHRDEDREDIVRVLFNDRYRYLFNRKHFIVCLVTTIDRSSWGLYIQHRETEVYTGIVWLN